jgi:hypothetical protein
MSGGDSLDLDTIFTGKESLADEIGMKWLEWDGARKTAVRRWQETLQYVYATSTRETENAYVGGLGDVSEDESEAGWSHSTHIPKLTEIADNLAAAYMGAIYPREKFFEFSGEDAESSKKEVRDNVEAYLLSKHRHQKLRDVIQEIINDYVYQGNCFGGVEYVREQVELNVGDKTEKIGYVGPRVYRISPYDIVFNPIATSFANSPKIIRSIKTLGELSRDVEDKADEGYRKEALQKALEWRSQVQQVGVEDFDKYCQMSYDGYGTASQYFSSGHVELLHFYGDLYDINTNTFYKNYVITVIDKLFVLRAQPLETWTGKPHIYHAAWRRRPDNLWGMGPLDNLVGMQYLINHLENARADAFDQMLEPTRVEIGDVEKVDVEAGRPGGTYRIPSGEGQVLNLLPDTTVLTADNQIQLKMNQMEQFAGLPKEQLGIRTPGEKTLGEVQELKQAANKIFQSKIAQLESMIESILNAELEVSRINMDVTDVVSVIGERGIKEFTEIRREDLLSNGSIVAMGARHFDRKQKILSNYQFLQQAVYQDPLAVQHLSSVGMAEMQAEILDLDQTGMVSPYVRVGEEAELVKLQQAAQTQIAAENQVDVGGEQLDQQPTQANPDTAG